MTVTIDKNKITIAGPKGTLEREVRPEIEVKIADDRIEVSRQSDDRQHRAFHGLTRALLANMVEGVSKGFRKSLEIVGVGYKVELRGNSMMFTLGYSHTILLQAPPNVTFEVEKPTLFHISGIDKELVGQVTAAARALRKPDPYKGKGVRYVGEYIRRKAGKTAK